MVKNGYDKKIPLKTARIAKDDSDKPKMYRGNEKPVEKIDKAKVSRPEDMSRRADSDKDGVSQRDINRYAHRDEDSDSDDLPVTETTEKPSVKQ